MKKTVLVILALLGAICASAADYSKTLRLDYILTGTAKESSISLVKMKSLDGWAGRRVNMDKLLLDGNGRVILKDAESGKVLYINSFSTLFREWQNSEEATRVRKSFECVLLVPMPERKAEVTVELYNDRAEKVAEYTHGVDPQDILIQKAVCNYPSEYILRSGDSSDCIDIAFVGEGYTADEAGKFFEECRFATECILSHEPFASMKERFNFVAVAPPSQESGVSIPHEGIWKNTALSSHFDTFYSERYLTTLNIFDLHNALAGVPYEHIIILANTDTYGGGGIYNSYMLSSTRHKDSKPVIVHEFGHSFAGLADEYFYDDQYEQFYFSDVEPWEPNITTLVDFESKWMDMVEEEGIVTKADQAAQKQAEREKAAKKGRPQAKDWAKEVKGYKVGLYEGAGYLSEGVYRPVPECRMKINEVPGFCPVCERAIRRLINYNTIEQD